MTPLSKVFAFAALLCPLLSAVECGDSSAACRTDSDVVSLMQVKRILEVRAQPQPKKMKLNELERKHKAAVDEGDFDKANAIEEEIQVVLQEPFDADESEKDWSELVANVDDANRELARTYKVSEAVPIPGGEGSVKFAEDAFGQEVALKFSPILDARTRQVVEKQLAKVGDTDPTVSAALRQKLEDGLAQLTLHQRALELCPSHVIPLLGHAALDKQIFKPIWSEDTTLFPHNKALNVLVTVMPKFGGDMEKLLAGGMRHVVTSLRLLLQIAEGLKCLNENGFFYRDMKLPNILIDNLEEPTRAVIADFGMCHDFGMGLNVEHFKNLIMKGTPSHEPPEEPAASLCTTATEAAAKADIWSFGVTLFSAIVGYSEVEGQTRADMIRDLQNPEWRQHKLAEAIENDILDPDLAHHIDSSLLAIIFQPETARADWSDVIASISILVQSGDE